MEIKIHQRKCDKNNTELYKKAVQFYAEQLLSKSKRNRLKISIVLKNFTGKVKNDIGSCEMKSRNQYKIEINKNKPFHSIISTLAHEMVHVKQGVSGKLVMKDEGFVWSGTMYKNVDIADCDVYNSMPWELEAYKLEVDLARKFFQIIIEEVKVINE